MNTYELAYKLINALGVDYEMLEQSAIMLRPQADRIAELEKVSKPVAWMDYLEHSNVYDLNVSGRGFPLYTAPQTLKPDASQNQGEEQMNDGYYCVVYGKYLPADEYGVIVHDDIKHPTDMTFDDEEKPQ